jgi:hypothetical protein
MQTNSSQLKTLLAGKQPEVLAVLEKEIEASRNAV